MWVKKSINPSARLRLPAVQQKIKYKEKREKAKNKTRKQKWSNKNLSRTTKVHSHFESQSGMEANS